MFYPTRMVSDRSFNVLVRYFRPYFNAQQLGREVHSVHSLFWPDIEPLAIQGQVAVAEYPVNLLFDVPGIAGICTISISKDIERTPACCLQPN